MTNARLIDILKQCASHAQVTLVDNETGQKYLLQGVRYNTANNQIELS